MAKVVGKKRWFKITAPKLFGDRMVGETPAYEPEQLMGKTMRINLFTLTDNMKRQNTEVNLLVEKVEGDSARTSIIGMMVLPTSIRRLVRKGKTRLDQAIKGITKDEKVVSVKVLLITSHIVQGQVQAALQKEAKRFLIKKIVATDFEELTRLAVERELSKKLREKLNKIYPLRICDIRHFSLERFVTAVDIRKIKEELARVKKAKVEIKVEEEEPVEQAAPVQEAAEAQN